MSTSTVPAFLAAGRVLLESVLDPEIVFDGPEVTGEAPAVGVAWGYDGNPAGTRQAVQNWRQTFVGIGTGAGRRDESYEVIAAVVGDTGDDSGPDAITAARTDVFAVFATIEAAVRGAELSTFGLAPPAQVEMQSGALYQEPSRSGLRIRLPFIVAVSRVRI